MRKRQAQLNMNLSLLMADIGQLFTIRTALAEYEQ